jgi:hypothetical protein
MGRHRRRCELSGLAVLFKNREGIMAASPDATLDSFFAVFVSGNPTAQKASDLIDLFCQDDSAVDPTIPAVGITHHGPNFRGVNEVKMLWNRFLSSFDDFRLSPAELTLPGQLGDVPAPRLYSQTNYPPNAAPIPMIAVQTTLSGDFVEDWFQKPVNLTAKDHSSPPLSNIRPVAADMNGPLHTIIPAAAVFAFDATSSLITHLWIYLDRFKLSADLNPGSVSLLAGFSAAIAKREDALRRARSK